MTIRLLIADDHEVVRCGLRSLVSGTDIEIIGEAATGDEAVNLALQEDPDVVLLGEMRDLDSIQIALSLAETGHLVFATLHTNDAPQALDRIIDVFPAEKRDQIQTMLAGSLQGVVSQRLLPAISGGRVAAYEFMVVTPAISNLIRENKVYRIESSIQIGKKMGMQLLDDHLWELYDKALIDLAELLDKARNPDDMMKKAQEKAGGGLSGGAKLGDEYGPVVGGSSGHD